MLCYFSGVTVTAQDEVTRRRQAIVTTAESQLHVREATGHNDGPDVRKYLRVTGLNEGPPWCAAFVSWVFQQAGTPAPRSARVVDWFKTNLVYNARTNLNKYTPPVPGMVIALYYNDLGRLGHIGIVTNQPPGKLKNVYTIEGNTNAAGSREGQGVYKKIRPWSTISAMADHVKH